MTPRMPKRNRQGPAFTNAAQLSRITRLREIIHDLKNYMSVLLLNLGNGETRESRTIEDTISKMNCLLEELAQLYSEQGLLQKADKPRTRVYRPQKLPAVTIR